MLLAVTEPSIARDLFFLEANKESRVVFPAPDGPMIASIWPGLQKPDTLSRMALVPTLAVTFFQVRVTS